MPLIPGFDHHTISPDGVITNQKTGRSKNIPWVGKNGYKCVDIWESNLGKKLYVHRALALTFLPNPDGKRTINHKDGNKLNNHLDNLEWATDSENMLHAYATGLTNGARKVTSDIAMEAYHRVLQGETLSKVSEDYPLCLASITTHVRKYVRSIGKEESYLQVLKQQHSERLRKRNAKRN